MPHLLNTLPHKKGTSVYVDGEIYKIDQEGVCRDVGDAHAEKLLKGKSWTIWSGKSPREQLEEIRAAKAAKALVGHKKAEKSNLDKKIEEKVRVELDRRMQSDGWRPPVSVPSLAEVQAAGYTEEASKKIVAREQAKAVGVKLIAADPVTDLTPAPTAAPATMDIVSDAPPPLPGMDAQPALDAPETAATAEVDADPPIPAGEGVEWPDPDPNYSMKWLKSCADAYEVSYPANIGAMKLTDKIRAAMYPDE